MKIKYKKVDLHSLFINIFSRKFRPFKRFLVAHLMLSFKSPVRSIIYIFYPLGRNIFSFGTYLEVLLQIWQNYSQGCSKDTSNGGEASVKVNFPNCNSFKNRSPLRFRRHILGRSGGEKGSKVTSPQLSFATLRILVHASIFSKLSIGKFILSIYFFV